MRIVFDTNVVVSALVFGRRLAWLRLCWARAELTPIVCRATVAELLRVLAYPKFRLEAGERAALLEDYLPFAETIILGGSPPDLPVDCRDRDDGVFLWLTLEARADALVSGDQDLAVLWRIAPVPILSVTELRALASRAG